MPVALLLVFVLLFAMFNNVKDGLLVFTGVPFALTGGIVALWLRDIPLSISAGVGFIALSGVAVLNGLVMIAFIRSLRENGMLLDVAVREGALMAAPGADDGAGGITGFRAHGFWQRAPAPRFSGLWATVVIGGILSSTALTLLVLPVLTDGPLAESPGQGRSGAASTTSPDVQTPKAHEGHDTMNHPALKGGLLALLAAACSAPAHRWSSTGVKASATHDRHAVVRRRGHRGRSAQAAQWTEKLLSSAVTCVAWRWSPSSGGPGAGRARCLQRNPAVLELR